MLDMEERRAAVRGLLGTTTRPSERGPVTPEARTICACCRVCNSGVVVIALAAAGGAVLSAAGMVEDERGAGRWATVIVATRLLLEVLTDRGSQLLCVAVAIDEGREVDEVWIDAVGGDGIAGA